MIPALRVTKSDVAGCRAIISPTPQFRFGHHHVNSTIGQDRIANSVQNKPSLLFGGPSWSAEALSGGGVCDREFPPLRRSEIVPRRTSEQVQGLHPRCRLHMREFPRR